MSEHTKTPWRTLPSRDASGDVGITADGLPNVLAECFADIRRAGEYAIGESAANAAFIVMACNAHDEMLAALKTIAEPIDTAQCVGDPWAFYRDLQAVARAALAKARGQS